MKLVIPGKGIILIPLSNMISHPFQKAKTKGNGDASEHFGILFRKRMEDDEK